ncbi:aminomethyl-transferring glycine dehydrogenase subunit GcvPA [Zavarzinella formosa]|uniref:aminomethyl-transferring glycine dehydrogenase subunit GcvPA n=1 Tax=Zavarzinella formosa TaxID=360055 RepID=UPI0004982040|nr:aminomethyl-transferring glycine dehydrogenase subunit GcvPA [Zavarzinella formosa]
MPYILNTPDDEQTMLKAIGAESIDELFSTIPAEARLPRALNIPAAMEEIELTQHVGALGRKNQAAGDHVCFLGGGAYDHFIPTVVDAVSSRSEFYTAYTPYQAEASQGSLQAFYEYQTLICQITGMDVANASLYEGGSAVAEAVLMAINVTDRKGNVVVPESLHPEYRQVLATYLANLGVQLVTIPTPGGYLDPAELKKAVGPETAAVVVQHPNFFGHLEEVEELVRITRAAGALYVASFDPISAGVIKRPGQYDADIAVAEGQCLGTPLGYGGPYLGIMACRNEYVRKIPGRLVGQTTDRNGKRCWTLTLQTREQHIRRDKATSNICTNQGLFALRAAVYLTALGPQGLKETAELCLQKAHYLADQLATIPGVSLKFNRPFFKEFAVKLPGDVPVMLKQLQTKGYFAGLHAGRWYPGLADTLTVAVTEKRTKAEMDGLVKAIKELVGK